MMSTQEFSMERAEAPRMPRRVVEAEIKLPKMEELKLPKVSLNLEPARVVAEQVLLTSLGVGVLFLRGVTAALKAANAAGVEAAQHPDPVTKALLGWVRPKPQAPQATTGIKRVPVMPIDNYEALAAESILEHLAGLSAEQLRVVRDYEAQHLARVEIIEAIAARLAAE